jgi:dolichol-phosphate mannosyltransferase
VSAAGDSKILIVTPTFNERDNLEPFLEGVFSAVPHAHVLVVDDASPDGTGALADALAAKDERVKVLHRPKKLGLGSAYLEGFARGLTEAYDLLFEMDTDLSHDPAYLPEMLRAFDEGADVVVGSRYVPGGGVEGWGPGRHALSRGGSIYGRLWLGVGLADLTSGFKGFRRRVLESIDLAAVRSEGYAFQIELTYRALKRGFRVAELPIVFVDRRAGQSKMSRQIFAEAVVIVPWLRLAAIAGRL